MKKITIDVAILGGGTAGLAAYREAKSLGKTAKIIEGGVFGTTCARVGCMPSKLLIAAAENYHDFQKSEAFGIEVDLTKVKPNGKKVMDRVKRERDRFVGFVLESVDEIDSEDKLLGYAKFINENSLQVGDDLIVEATSFVIATGSRPVYPNVWKEELGDRLIINDDVFNWNELPEKVAVFGAGVIGLELGQALHRLDVNVKLFSIGGAIGALTDKELIDYTEKTIDLEFYFDINANVKSIKLNDNKKVEITFINKNTNKEEIEEFDYLLAATGRRPNVDGIGLENLNIDLDEKQVPISDKYTMQTSLPNIFIAGDSSNQLPLLHEAADQGKIAGHNAAIFPNVKTGLRRTPISIVFSDPQIAMVGESRREIEQRLGSCGCFKVGTVSFENQGRSRVMLKNKGMMNVYAENGTGIFLGAEMTGPSAEHLAHLLAWACQNKMTIPEMLNMPFYHPVIEEGLRTALRDLNEKLNFDNETIMACQNCGMS